MTDQPPVALTIAGSDSGAGAGIQADLKTMGALGVFGVTAITAVTAQNTATVAGVHPVPAAFVEQQVATLLADLPVAATKTGMLGNAETIAVVGGFAGSGALPNLVVDPVMVSSSGQPLLDDGGVAAYRELLLPFALVVTPNLWEAALLCGRDPRGLTDEEGMADAARTIHAMGAAWVLVKGGHLAGVEPSPGTPAASAVPDVLYGGSTVTVLTAEWVDTPNTHGTGCSLSAAIAAQLASGAEVATAVADAKAYVNRALAGAAGWRLGKGHGPLDHFGGPVAPRRSPLPRK
ncbi:MAG TPA: bifunctional hydroxymethylpyrimidine kinase/phosphomethylpyrimidine kinase [Acidimicrobiales bacterium]|nr:bifunctional hydroxymethylpyrimidine kinase/phosphomethylpyrimidine kinase [Acidimicrobiales bacterium]